MDERKSKRKRKDREINRQNEKGQNEKGQNEKGQNEIGQKEEKVNKSGVDERK